MAGKHNGVRRDMLFTSNPSLEKHGYASVTSLPRLSDFSPAVIRLNKSREPGLTLLRRARLRLLALGDFPRAELRDAFDQLRGGESGNRITSLLSGHGFPALPKLFPVSFHREFREETPMDAALIHGSHRVVRLNFAIFPVNFPVSREFGR